MPRCSLSELTRPRLTILLFLAVVGLAFAPSSRVFAQTAQETENESPSEESLVPELPAVPVDTSPESVSEYLNELNGVRPAAATRAGQMALIKALGERVDELIAEPLATEAAIEANGFRFALYSLANQFGIDGTEEKRAAWVKNLKADKTPAIAQFGRGMEILIDTQDAASTAGGASQWSELIDRTVSLLNDSNMSDFAASIAVQMSEFTQVAAPRSVAISAHEKFASVFAASDDPRFRAYAPELAGVARRLNLPGQPMIIRGTTLDGDAFDLQNYDGKVVLVDFWATWCPSCIATFPELESLYKEYHDRGLEIVGVNIDDTKQLWTEYLEKNPLPWTHVQNLGDENTDKHPNASYYGVNGIPFLVVIGRDGRVIETDVAPQQLEAIVRDAMGDKAE